MPGINSTCLPDIVVTIQCLSQVFTASLHKMIFKSSNSNLFIETDEDLRIMTWDCACALPKKDQRIILASAHYSHSRECPYLMPCLELGHSLPLNTF